MTQQQQQQQQQTLSLKLEPTTKQDENQNNNTHTNVAMEKYGEIDKNNNDDEDNNKRENNDNEVVEVEKYIRPVDPFFAAYFGDSMNGNTNNNPSSSIEMASQANDNNNVMHEKSDSPVPPLPFIESFNQINEEAANTDAVVKKQRKKHRKNKKANDSFKMNDDKV